MDWFLVSPLLLPVLFLTAMAAAFIDALAGGGGLLTVPALMAAGLTPAQALATNKLQSVGGAFSASMYFIRHNRVRLKTQWLNIIVTFLAAALGALLIQHLQADLLRRFLPLLVIIPGLWLLLVPLPQADRPHALQGLAFALIVGGIGFYDGFFGPGAGTFYAFAFLLAGRLNLANATAHAKVLNFVSNFSALLFFIVGGKVVWGTGILMWLGAFCGARLGAGMVLHRGQQLIRPVVVLVSLLISAKLLWQQYGAALMAWLMP